MLRPRRNGTYAVVTRHDVAHARTHMNDSTPLIPDISRDYDLLRAYLLLAKRMFPRQWTPNNCELQMRDNSKLFAAKSAEKKDIDLRMAELRAARTKLDTEISKNTNNQIVETARLKRDEIISEISTLYSRLALMPDIPGLERDVEQYQRRMEVEEKLIKAISTREVQIWSMFNIPDDRGPWEKRPGYKYDIALSTVWWPQRVYEGRRQFVRVFKDIFDDWLKTIAPEDIGDFERLPREDKARLIAKQIVQESPPGRLKRSSFIDQLQTDSGISRKKAAILWDTEVPANRKLAGRPRVVTK